MIKRRLQKMGSSLNERVASLETSQKYNLEIQNRILEKQDILISKMDNLKDDMISKKSVIFLSTIVSCAVSAISFIIRGIN